MPFFLVRTPDGYGVLTTRGRKTGKPRRKCIRAIVDGDRAYLVAIGGGNAAWVKNILHDPRVRLRLGRRWFDGTAAELSDPADLVAARDVYCGTVVPFDYPTCRVHRRGVPSRGKIVELTTAWFEGGTPVVVRLDH
jgi:deazaflavin-dependent oxidoreductase (nitroreductase family)